METWAAIKVEEQHWGLLQGACSQIDSNAMVGVHRLLLLAALLSLCLSLSAITPVPTSGMTSGSKRIRILHVTDGTLLPLKPATSFTALLSGH